MSDLMGDNSMTEEDTSLPNENTATENEDAEPAQSTIAQVSKIIRTIKDDKAYHAKPFKQMRADMFMAFHGRDETYAATNYKANIAGRHVKQKTASLYAKNPTATAIRNERMDFTIWDENPKSLMMAMQIVQQAQMADAVAKAAPLEPTAMGQLVPAQPQLPQGFEQAQAIVADFQQGEQYRQMVDKIGRTLEILFARALRDQEPLDFKTAAKALVRRACTCGVGYVELGFIRETGPRPDLDAQLADAKARLDHLQRLAHEVIEGEIDEDAAEMSELQLAIQALTTEPEIVLREGLVFDFPEATKVIPDKLTKQLVGFVGARHLTLEYLFTCEEVEEMFPDADIKKGYKGYGPDGKSYEGAEQPSLPGFDEDGDDGPAERTDGEGKGLVCVWKHYDKMSGLVYYVADGHKDFLRPPAAPDVFVEKFWPVFALTFNAVENEKELFPRSDVYLLSDQQMEHNRARQGMREHRQAARPRWATSAGLMDESAEAAFKSAQPFDLITLNKDPATKIEQLLEVIPVPGVDPNLYATEQFEQDRQMSVGMSDAAMGGMSKATATESAISANSTLADDTSSKDDLDSFLSAIARAASQILLKEMSEEQVKKIVGPGAVWPELSLQDIAGEIFLEVEAGSSGRPNQAVEIENFTKMVPMLIQIPGLDPAALAKEGIRRLGDRLDVNKFLLSNAPSIVSMNQQKQPGMGGDPAADPNAQGAEGGANGAQPPGQESPGSGPGWGSNQVDRPAA